MKKNLIIYFSLTGNTDFIAKKLAQDLDADILKIIPSCNLKKMRFLKMLIGIAQVLLDISPKIKYNNININNYENIIIGSPVWADTYVPALKSFFKIEKIKEKNIGIFVCCNGGEGHAIKDLTDTLKDNKCLASQVFIDTIKNKMKTDDDYMAFLKELSKNS